MCIARVASLSLKSLPTNYELNDKLTGAEILVYFRRDAALVVS